MATYKYLKCWTTCRDLVFMSVVSRGTPWRRCSVDSMVRLVSERLIQHDLAVKAGPHAAALATFWQFAICTRPARPVPATIPPNDCPSINNSAPRSRKVPRMSPRDMRRACLSVPLARVTWRMGQRWRTRALMNFNQTLFSREKTTHQGWGDEL